MLQPRRHGADYVMRAAGISSATTRARAMWHTCTTHAARLGSRGIVGAREITYAMHTLSDCAGHDRLAPEWSA